jgi:hypothetical protein
VKRHPHQSNYPFEIKLFSVREALGLVHTFRFSTGREVAHIAGQSSGTQESIGVFTQPGPFPGREYTGRLPGSTRIHPLLCPVTGRSMSQQLYM